MMTNIGNENVPAKLICAWCMKDIGTSKVIYADTPAISHSICAGCYELQMNELESSEMDHGK
jgi:hypothetical protein